MKRAGLMALLAGAALSLAASSYGQDASKQAKQGEPQKQAAKPRKVWTDDDLGTLRRTSGVTVPTAYVEAAPNANAAAETQAAAAKQPAAKPGPKDHPPLLSNPKSADDADRMIAWETRDVDSQQEYVDRLQTQLETATGEQREHLQELLAERQRILADTRRERQDLMAQKKELEKKAAAKDNVAAASQP